MKGSVNLFKDLNHFTRRDDERFPGKMPRVSRNQVRILLAHLDLIENDVLGVGEGFVSDLGTVEVQAMIKKHLQGMVNVGRIQMELFPGQYIAVFPDDFVVKDWSDVSGINMGNDDEGRGCQVCRYQRGNKDIGVDDRK